jgi:phosphoenolpyruvate carboxylase
MCPCQLTHLSQHQYPCCLPHTQGETIEQQFGEQELCFKTLDMYTSAVLEASLDEPASPDSEWRFMMDK